MVRIERKRDCQDGLHFEVFHPHTDDEAWAAVVGALGPDALRSEERWGAVRTRTAVVPFQLEVRIGERPGRATVVFRVGTSRDTRAFWLTHLEDALRRGSELEVATTEPERPEYFDHAASTPCDPRVIARLAERLAQAGHPDATHVHGRAMRARLDEAATVIAEAVGGAEHVTWTSGATEANRLAITGAERFVATRAAHPSALEPLDALARTGAEVTYVPLTRDGTVDLERLLAVVDASSARTLVSIAHASSVTGVLQPIASIAARLPAHAIFHVDAAQSFTRDEGALGHPRIDRITVSAHKLGGPVGIGALVSRGPAFARRSGTIGVALAEAFALAVQLARAEAPARKARCLATRATLLEVLAPLGVVPVTDAPTLAHVLCLRFPGFDARAVQLALAPKMSVSLGSACQAGSPEPSPSLLAMGLSRTEAREALRLSWSHTSRCPDLREIVGSLLRARTFRTP